MMKIIIYQYIRSTYNRVAQNRLDFNSLYILNEPSIGLHSRDTERLIGVLKSLRDLGNTVVVVEHDEMMMREADHIIDMGPMASHLGGEVVAEGNYDEIIYNPMSLTGKYLSGVLKIEPPKSVRKWNQSVTVNEARQHNLKNISVGIFYKKMAQAVGRFLHFLTYAIVFIKIIKRFFNVRCFHFAAIKT